MVSIVERLYTMLHSRMNIPKEKSLAPSTYGVYPRPRDLPSPVCCFRIMHIRTGSLWIAYCEMLWITSQISFWAAQAVTGGWSPSSICIGFGAIITQIVLVVALIKGTQHFRLSLLNIYMCGLLIRTLIFGAMMFMLLFITMADIKESSMEGYREMIWLKIVFLLSLIGLKLFGLLTVNRCYSYIKRTKDFFRGPARVDSKISTPQFAAPALNIVPRRANSLLPPTTVPRKITC